MKLKAPEGCTSVAHGGVVLTVASDGSIEVEERLAKELASHGFRPWDSGAGPVPVEAMTHAQLVLHVLERTRLALLEMSTEELRERILETTPRTVILPDETEGAGINIDPDKVDADSIEKMNRPQLFAFLKAKGIAVSLPIKNDELREYARMAIADASKTSSEADDGAAGQDKTEGTGQN